MAATDKSVTSRLPGSQGWQDPRTARVKGARTTRTDCIADGDKDAVGVNLSGAAHLRGRRADGQLEHREVVHTQRAH